MLRMCPIYPHSSHTQFKLVGKCVDQTVVCENTQSSAPKDSAVPAGLFLLDEEKRRLNIPFFASFSAGPATGTIPTAASTPRPRGGDGCAGGDGDAPIGEGENPNLEDLCGDGGDAMAR
jgi:hypothetical protein